MTMAEDIDKDNSEQAMVAVVKPDPGSSFLVAEIGRVTCSVVLFDIVDGVYRLVATGDALNTAGQPWYDARHGLRAAIEQVARATGRLMINADGELLRPRKPGGEGIDYFGLVTAVAEPMRTLLIGLLEDVSLASGRAALKTAYSREIDCFHLGDTRTRTEQVRAFLDNNFDLVLVVGGTDGGADRRLVHEVETLAIGLELLAEDERPPVMYAGNTALRSKIESILGDLVTLYFADNVRPAHELQDLDSAVSVK